MIVSIDFETRSQIDLKKRGAHVYAAHPSTEILCLSYSIDGGPRSTWYGGDFDEPDDLYNAIEAGDKVRAFNTNFERLIWPLMRREGAPAVGDRQWVCTAAEARAVALPRNLDQAAKAAGSPIEKDRTGSGLMLRMSKPKADGSWYGDAADLKRLGQYCETDVAAEMSLAEIVPQLDEREAEVFAADQAINDRGFRIDRAAVEAVVEVIGKLEQSARAELPKITNGEVQTPGQLDKIIHFAMQYFLELPNLQKDTVTKALEQPDLAPELRRVLTIRQQFGRSSTKKFKAMLERANDDDRVRGAFVYSGAGRTRRWSGMGVQPQNFKRGYSNPDDIEDVVGAVLERNLDYLDAVYGDAMEAISNVARGMIIPADGCEFIVSDYASVEARVLAVLAGDRAMVRMFHDGVDPYKDMAAAIYEVSYDDVTSAQRFVGKQAILGLGYGMGYKRFIAQCGQYGTTISTPFAKSVVKLYRRRRKAVTVFWSRLQADAVKCIQTGTPAERKAYSLRLEGTSLVMTLASGSERWYQNASLELGELELGEHRGEPVYEIAYWGLGETNQWVKIRTYGGKLVENLVQSTARDLLADSLVELERRGIPVVMHLHDEIVCEAPFGTVDPDELGEVMCTASPWAEGWPIETETWVGTRYRK